ncbi:hypothetical protein GGF41_004005, partial [Coemansia sp. RSA 2531]
MLCHKCGRPGHMAAQCTEAEKRCFNCGEPGHLTLNCTLPRDDSLKECFNCGQKGHLSKSCEEPRVPRPTIKREPKVAAPVAAVEGEEVKGLEGRLGKPRRARNGGNKKPVLCYVCNREGHVAKACPESDQAEKVDDRECR